MRRCLLGSLIVTILSIATASGQIINVTNATATPVPGSGHDYIQMLSETVNPANGSVSVRIAIPVPPGRQLTLPFAIAYDSNGLLFFQALSNGSAGWAWDNRAFASGGWHYTLPMLSDVHTERVTVRGYIQYRCRYYTGYVFYDAKGVRHPLPLAYVPDPNSSGCMNQDRQLSSYLYGHDEFVQATWSSLSQTVSEPDGTQYYFTKLDATPPVNGSYSALPDWVKDRNGNFLSFNWVACSTSFSMQDTVGRTALSASGFGDGTTTLTVSGLDPYILTWDSVSPGYPVGFSPINGNSPYCSLPVDPGGTFQVLKTLTLPNGKQ